MAFNTPIDTSTPVQTETLTRGDNRIRETKEGLQELLNVDHEASLTGTSIDSVDSGCHNKTTLIEQATDPSAPTGVTSDFGILYTKLDSDTSQSELFWRDENDNVLQITKGNTIDLDLNFLSNNTALEGNLVGEASAIPMIKVSTNDQVLIGHTTAKPARLASNAPPLDEADIANMKYVDDQVKSLVAASSRNKDTNYTAASDGFLLVEAEFDWVFNQTQEVIVLSDDNATPTTEVSKMGSLCKRADSADNRVFQSMLVPILSGKQYRVEDTGTQVTINRISFFALSV